MTRPPPPRPEPAAPAPGSPRPAAFGPALAGLVAAALILAAQGGFAAPPEAPAGVVAERDIVYKTDGGDELKLDLYRPADAGDKASGATGPGRPMILFIHGEGGYRKGGKEEFLEEPFWWELLGPLVLENGYAVAAMDYRRAGKKTLLSDLITDCADARRWVARDGPGRGLDPGRTALLGHAAGGHLALVAALAPASSFRGDPALAEADPPPPAAAVALNPITDFLKVAKTVEFRTDKEAKRQRNQLKTAFDGTYKEVPNNYREASPVHHIRPTSPPVLLIAGQDGEADAQAAELDSVARRARAPVERVAVAKAGDDLLAGNAEATPGRRELQARIRSFLRTHLNR